MKRTNPLLAVLTFILFLIILTSCNMQQNLFVTLDSQGGTGGTALVLTVYEEAMPPAKAPTKTGNIFGGYFSETNGNGTQYYTAEMESARNWDLTYYATLFAKWIADSCTVTLDSQGGTGGTASVEADYGEIMPSASAPTKGGYTFGGYYTEENGTGTQYYTAEMGSTRNWDLTADTTLYAKWITESYTVTFDRQGGTGGTASVEAAYEEAMPTAAAPTRDWYIFEGYFDQINGAGTQYYTAAMESTRSWDRTADTTLYAKWEFGTGPAGGLIFYDKGSFSDGWRYLEAAPSATWDGDPDNNGEEPSYGWGEYTLVGGTSNAVGTGEANTQKIVAKMEAESYAGTYAAKECADHSVTVDGIYYADWFLPSKDELNLMYQNLYTMGKGDFDSTFLEYFSSTEYDSHHAWSQNYLDDGKQMDFEGKSHELKVRPVRAF